MIERHEAWGRMIVVALGAAALTWTLMSHAAGGMQQGDGGASAYRACGGRLTGTAAAGGVSRCDGAELNAREPGSAMDPGGVALRSP